MNSSPICILMQKSELSWRAASNLIGFDIMFRESSLNYNFCVSVVTESSSDLMSHIIIFQSIKFSIQ